MAEVNSKREYHKQWYQKNKDRVKNYSKVWRAKNAEKIKEYRLNNVEKLKEAAKKSYYKHKDRKNKQRKQAYELKKYSVSYRFKNLKYAAKRRQIEFNLNLEQFKTLANQNCYYCASEIKTTIAGLDRINNSGGYTLDNVLPCCTTCNYIRGNELTVEETKVVITALMNYRKSL